MPPQQDITFNVQNPEEKAVNLSLSAKHYAETLDCIKNLSVIEKYKNEYLNIPAVNLKPSKHKKVLIFDLDETMVHTLDERDPPSMQGKVRLFIPDGNGHVTPIQVNIRPHLAESLQILS